MAIKDVGLKEIAAELNVSMNTVSRALRDCKDISKKTKESVRLKAIEMGYLPSTMSKLSYNGKRLIAVATSEFKNLFFATMCSNLFKKIREDPNYEITIVNSNSRVDATVIKNCISQRVDALISLFEFEEEAVELAKVNNIPLVLIGLVSKYDYVFSIRTDDEFGSEIVANYLVNYHHLNKFVYVSLTSKGNSFTNDVRSEYFKSRIFKLLPDASFKEVCFEGIRKGENIQEILQMIKEGYYGFYCFNDDIVYVLLRELNKLVPNIRLVFPQLHIIGYDALCEQNCGMIDITSIKYSFEELALEAINCVKAYFDNKEYTLYKVPVRLHQRKK